MLESKFGGKIRKKQLGVVCIKMLVKGGDESTERK